MNKTPPNAFGIIIIAHGGLAQQYLATLLHVIGVQDRIVAVSFDDTDSKAEKREEISKLVNALDVGTGVVIATDMYGGTPSNLAMNLGNETKSLGEVGDKGKRNILYGVNMPALIKLARMRDHPIDEAVKAAVEAGHRYLNFCEKQG